MSDTTKIQWCDSTVNPTMGCDGCELWNMKVKKCYAGAMHVRRGGKTKGFSPTFEELTTWPGRMARAANWKDLTGMVREDKPWLDGLPRLIFVSDMSDALSSPVPFDYLREEIIANVTTPAGRRHRWLWLTKRPDRMAQFSESLSIEGIAWPENLWAGTSITTQATTGRIEGLLRVGDERTTRFLSAEPQVGPIDLSGRLPGLDWVIQGGESGPGARPFHLEWALDLRRQCRDAGVPYFLKQLGTTAFSQGQRLKLADHHGGDWSGWPQAIRVREMPIGLTTAGVGTPADDQGPKTSTDRSEIARKAWATRRLNELRRKHREAGLKAWATRRSREKGK
jgi:protein gp37